VILHGLNGSSDDAYVRYLAFIARPPFRVAAFLMRGCGDMPLTTRRGYSAADSNDFADAMDQVGQYDFSCLREIHLFCYNLNISLCLSLIQLYIDFECICVALNYFLIHFFEGEDTVPQCQDCGCWLFTRSEFTGNEVCT